MTIAEFHTAAKTGDTKTARLLLKAGVDVNIRDGNGNTALMWVCLDHHPEIVKLLLGHGADVNARNAWGYTPLHVVACRGGYPDIARLLLDHGVDVRVRDNDGRTPLDALLSLPPDSPTREELLDLFREYVPELVFEAFCTAR